jgi:hypothetical protein
LSGSLRRDSSIFIILFLPGPVALLSFCHSSSSFFFTHSKTRFFRSLSPSLISPTLLRHSFFNTAPSIRFALCLFFVFQASRPYRLSIALFSFVLDVVTCVYVGFCMVMYTLFNHTILITFVCIPTLIGACVAFVPPYIFPVIIINSNNLLKKQSDENSKSTIKKKAKTPKVHKCHTT